MPRRKKEEPEVHIADLHPVNDGFVHAYNASWQESGVIAHLVLDIVSTDHWQPGLSLQNAYELTSLNPTTMSGRPLGPVQQEYAGVLLRKLRERMLDLMKVAGWRRVADNNIGQPIYQFRPAQRVEAEISPTPSVQHSTPEQEAGITTDNLEADSPHKKKQPGQMLQPKVYRVFGSEEARKSGKEPAYSRTVSARQVSFRCTMCGQLVTEMHYPGQAPSICEKSACKREAVRQRVQKSRAQKKKAKTVW